MHYIIYGKNKWSIYDEKGVVLSGVGGIQVAIYFAALHDIALEELKQAA